MARKASQAPGRRPLALAVVLLALLAVGAGAAWAELTYQGGKLGARLEGQALGVVLTEAQRLTGVRFTYGRAAAARSVSATFSGLPLEQGLRRLLAGFNTLIILSPTGRPLAVHILGDGAAGAAADQGPAAPTAADASTPPPPSDTLALPDAPVADEAIDGER